MAVEVAQAGGVHQFGSIYLASTGAAPQGTLKLEDKSFTWRKQGGGTTVQVLSKDVEEAFWARTGRDHILTVKKTDGSQLSFLGFRERDLEELKARFGKEIQDRQLSVQGRNWGEVNIEDSQLSFDVEGKKAFEVTMKDISQASLQGKNEVALEFQTDDTGAATKEDALVEMSFYVPPGSTTYVGDDEKTAAKVFLEQILKKADLVTSSDDIILSMPEIAVVTPRGRYEVQLYMNFLKLVGQSQDFKIRYSSIMRIFVLPKVHQPQTLVVLSLDPPIRKGQTFYPHVLFQFHDDDFEEVNLNISDEALEKKNAESNNKMERSFDGPSNDVFARVVRGLSGVKISKPQKFKNSSGDGHCVRCSYKSDDGYLFPLERAFFYVQKPPILILFDDVESVEFQRQSSGSQYTSAAKTFDLLIRTKSDTEYLFRSIQKQEWQNLFTFIQERNLKIENLKQVQQSMGGGAGASAAAAGLDDGEDDESDEEDEDFQGDEDSDDGDSDDSDASDDDGSDDGDSDDSDDSDDDSDEDEAPKKKKAKK